MAPKPKAKLEIADQIMTNHMKKAPSEQSSITMRDYSGAIQSLNSLRQTMNNSKDMPLQMSKEISMSQISMDKGKQAKVCSRIVGTWGDTKADEIEQYLFLN